MTMHQRVAFVGYRYFFGVSSMIINSVRLFARHGIGVDVYIDSHTFGLTPATLEEDGIKIIQYESPFRTPPLADFLKRHSIRSYRFDGMLLLHPRPGQVLLDLLKRFHRFLPAKVIRLLYLDDLLFSIWLRRRLRSGYDYVFAVEAESLIATIGFNGRVVYYNMEMLDWADKNPIYGEDKIVLKILESRAIEDSACVVIQNEARAEQFRRINKYSKKIHILPVAALGEAVRVKTTYLRDKFKIPENKHIVLYAGNIMPWARCKEIVESVRNWPADCCLVMHTYFKGIFAYGYGLEVKKLAEGLPIYISEEYLDLEELTALLSSADVALMFYEAIDANFMEILFSSNKFAEYLKAGLPIITSDFPALRQFVSETGIGRAVGAMEDIPAALVEILGRPDEFRRNVARCYENHFRFERFFERFYGELYTREAEPATLARLAREGEGSI